MLGSNSYQGRSSLEQSPTIVFLMKEIFVRSQCFPLERNLYIYIVGGRLGEWGRRGILLFVRRKALSIRNDQLSTLVWAYLFVTICHLFKCMFQKIKRKKKPHKQVEATDIQIPYGVLAKKYTVLLPAFIDSEENKREHYIYIYTDIQIPYCVYQPKSIRVLLPAFIDGEENKREHYISMALFDQEKGRFDKGRYWYFLLCRLLVD